MTTDAAINLDRGVETMNQAHQHFGYWINRRSRTARCYECQYQFYGDDTTAEKWVGQPRQVPPKA